jgi:Sulfotransferase domain
MNGWRWNILLVALLATLALFVQIYEMKKSASFSDPSWSSSSAFSTVDGGTEEPWKSDYRLVRIDFSRSKRSAESERERMELLGSGTVPSLNIFWNTEQQSPTPQARFLVDYVLAGFPKCGTTAVGHLLSSHPLIKDTGQEEHYILQDMGEAMNGLYSTLLTPWSDDENITSVVRGFRCPHQIHMEEGIRMISEVFTEAKVIVSVRHPVWWFQSYYNYRMEQNDTDLLQGLPNDLIGNLKEHSRSEVSPWILQTATGEFHRYLAAMKKTPLIDPEEITLLSPFWNRDWNISRHTRMPNPVFFCEISQLGDKNETRKAIFRKDLQNFLGLTTDFPPIPHIRPGNNVFNEDKRINICDEQFSPVRSELMNVARHASLWLRKYFMRREDVYYSSGEFLDELLQKWMVDPCQGR